MLIPNRKINKDYDTMMSEALSEIPIYTDEWSNFNASDPGVTILENLTAFNALQLESMDETGIEVKNRLLKLAGFEPLKGEGARVLMCAKNLEEDIVLSANQRFMLGDICFETNKEKLVEACRVVRVFSKHNNKLKDFSYVLDPEIGISASVFGEHPKEGDEIYLVMNRVPSPQTETLFYLEVNQSRDRNPISDKLHNRFAKIEWSCYTTAGFVPMNVKDETEGFLIDGEIHFRMPAETALVYSTENFSGYVFKGVLKKAQYDRAPKLENLTGFLFEVNQKETKAITYSYARTSTVLVHSNLMDQGFYKVFCLEDKDAGYELYEEISPDEVREGRFFTVQKHTDGYYELHFNRKKYGYGPMRTKNSVKVLVYDGDMMSRYYLGEVFGYDNQEIELPVKNIITSAFSMLAVYTDDAGKTCYDFLKPNREGDEEFNYYVFENEGKIRILDAGKYIGAKLYVASVAVTSGSDGNIRPWNHFMPVGDITGTADFVNPKAGVGGRFMETFEETRRRYVKDLYKPYAAVTEKDYEERVATTPGLCIHKVRAVYDTAENSVEIIVKPNTLEDFPKLSDDYREIIEERLEQCRLLSTKVVIRQPVYLPLEVKGTIYVNRQYENSREMIEKNLREELDYIHGIHNFGDVVQFDTIIRKLEQLPCVKQVYDLAVFPQNAALGKRVGANVVPVENCLCYPGDFNLVILTND